MCSLFISAVSFCTGPAFNTQSERVALKFWNVKNRHHELQFNCCFQNGFQCARTHYIVCNSLNLCKTHTLLSIAYISFSLAACNAHNNKVSAKSNLLKNALSERGFEGTWAKQGKCEIKLKFAKRKINNRESGKAMSQAPTNTGNIDGCFGCCLCKFTRIVRVKMTQNVNVHVHFVRLWIYIQRWLVAGVYWKWAPPSTSQTLLKWTERKQRNALPSIVSKTQ